MIIVFQPEKETKKRPQYCVKYTQKDGVVKCVIFGQRQRKMLIEWLLRKLYDEFITEYSITKIYDYEN